MIALLSYTNLIALIFYITDMIKLYLYSKFHLSWLVIDCFEIIFFFA